MSWVSHAKVFATTSHRLRICDVNGKMEAVAVVGKSKECSTDKSRFASLILLCCGTLVMAASANESSKK